MGILSVLEPTLVYLTQFLRNADISKFLPERPPPEPTDAEVFLEWRGGGPVALHAPETALVRMMTTLLRSRSNWIGVPDALARVDKLCKQVLRYLGIDDSLRDVLAGAGLLEVRCVEQAEAREAGWDFPWEFVLAEATRTHRAQIMATTGQTFQVVRHLDMRDEKRPSAAGGIAGAPKQVLVVTSAPGWIREHYDFQQEQRMIVSSLSSQVPCDELRDPDLPGLRDFVRSRLPDVIHLTGVDAKQGISLLRSAADAAPPGSGTSLPSGVYLREGNRPQIVSFPDVASAIATHGPRLVILNMYNSAIGAATLVSQGAEAAIGFQDEIDDATAERFCASVYGNWKRFSWDLGAALEEAWRSVAREPTVRGSGIVFWSRQSLVRPAQLPADTPADPVEVAEAIGDKRSQQRRRRPKSKGTPPEETTPATSTIAPPVEPTVASGLDEENVVDPETVTDARARVAVDCEALTKLNFSLLHNNQDIFAQLKIRRQMPGVYRGIRVDVRLAAGSEEAVYTKTLDLDSREPLVDLRDKVRLAMTTRRGQVLAESMFGTISTRVCWGRHFLYEDTQRIELLPIDEWRFDPASGRWLPSFVFPRDPAVRRIIDAAQSYLVALRDDSSAGFDGYQSFDPNGRTINERARNVDAQVQAIWWALVNEFTLSYINPPPTFTTESQRLRSPSQVLDGRRGTCIDLALLLASCFEYIDIYPVVFLLKDHAFPGYWRSEEDYKVHLSSVNLTPGSAEGGISNDVPWMFGTAQFDEVLDMVREGLVIPIESTFLTSRGGFENAVSEGGQNLRRRSDFESMFDIRRARGRVTPVPIWGHGP